MQALVVSNKESRRTTYFIKAGECVGIDTRFVTYNELLEHLSEYDNVLIKLEPPVHQETGFIAYHALCKEYIAQLEQLARREKSENTHYLNEPQAIAHTLDKVKSKELLEGLPTTLLLSSSIGDFEALTDFLSGEKYSNVFVKPRFGSGAGGIMAFKYNKKRDDMVAYTTLSAKGSYVYNTKRINRLVNLREIAVLANAVLQSGALVERWMLKDTLDAENYDLRVVCQFGKVEHIVVRSSKSAITNLHLNNKARSFDDLKLPLPIIERINSLCVRATQLSGLQYAGVDMLIERDTQTPYIIEVNGQGDHIYQDMYNGNKIYKKQLSTINH